MEYHAKVVEEGHYLFLFKNKGLHQLIIENKRCHAGCSPKFEKDAITKESWKTSRHVNVNGTEYDKRKLKNGTRIHQPWVVTMKIGELDMDAGFLNCFAFHDNLSSLYEHVKTNEVRCHVNEETSSSYVKDCDFDATLNKISFYTNWSSNVHMDPLVEIYVDLQCEINVVGHPVQSYLFSQPDKELLQV